MRPPKIVSLACLLLSAATLSCSGGQGPHQKLVDSVHRYNEAVRWRAHEKAASYVPVAQRETYLETRRSSSKDMKILDYEIEQIRQVLKNQKAEARVRFSWVKMPNNIVQRTTFVQTWKYGENKKWTLGDQRIAPKDAAPSKDVPLSDQF